MGPRDFLLYLCDSLGLPADQEFWFQTLASQPGAHHGKQASTDNLLFSSSAADIGASILAHCDCEYPNVYIVSGLYDANKIEASRKQRRQEQPGRSHLAIGRTMENCTTALWATIDLDAATWIARRSGSTDHTGKARAEEELRGLDDEALKVRLREHYADVQKISAQVQIPPSYWVCSGYGFYAIYLFADGSDIEACRAASEALQRRWCEIAGYPVADATIDAGTRLVRLPGTWNTKAPERPRQCRLLKRELADTATYRPEQILERLKPTRQAPEPVEQAPDGDLFRKLSRATLTMLAPGFVIPTGQRNNDLFRAAADMAGAGFERDDVLGWIEQVGTRSGLSQREINSVVNSAFSRERTPSITLDGVELGEARTLRDISLECRVLALALRNQAARFQILSNLMPSDYWMPEAAEIHRTISRLQDEQLPIDAILVRDDLFSRNQDKSAAVVSEIAKLSAPADDVADSIQHLRNLSCGRRTLRICEDMIDRLSNGWQPGCLDTFYDQVVATLERRTTQDWVPIGDLTDLIRDRILAEMANPGCNQTGGYQTGIYEIDRIIGRMEDGNNTVIVGDTGHGKTSFGIQVLQSIAETSKVPVGILSLELTNEQNADKIAAANIGVAMSRIRTGTLGEDERGRFSEWNRMAHELPLYTFAGINTIHEVRSAITHGVVTRGIKVFLVDFIQQIAVPGLERDRNNMISSVCRQLCDIALRLRVHLIWASQARRPERTLKNWRPAIHDCYGSGAIEQSVRLGFSIWQEQEGDPNDPLRIAEVAVVKNNFGGLGRFRGSFDCSNQRFTNMYPYRQEDEDDYGEDR